MHRVAQEDETEDELTGLANRRQFTALVQEAFARAERAAAPLALVLADLDDFKSLNDRFGIRSGDQVLKTFAGLLRRNTRDVDLPARIGGEEFGVLLIDTDAEGARQFAERLRAELRETAGLPALITASLGVASYPEARTAEDLLASASTGLRRAKEAGKDRVVVADGSPSERARA
jgi:diguanylate cyclase (GGDEF)-like protein